MVAKIALPRISSYGDYGANYGMNALEVAYDRLTLYFSYKTLVAFYTPQSGLVVHQNYWSRTTGKHLNCIDSDKSRRVSAETFERLWQTHVVGVVVDSKLGTVENAARQIIIR